MGENAIRIVPFEPDHLTRIVPGVFDIAATEGFDLGQIAADRADIGPAWSAVVDNGTRVLGCAGIVRLWCGVGTAWLYGGDELRLHPLLLHRAVARGLRVAEHGLRLHRIQISVHADFTASRTWVERLGFVFEGAMPGYGPDGATYLRYAKVRHVGN